MSAATPTPAGPLRTSSGLFADSLSEARESVVRWLERDRRSGHNDLPDAKIQSVASVARLAVNDVLAQLYRAGVASGRIAVCLALGIAAPDGPEQVHCPHCGKTLTAL